jgi:N-carbamoylputrescine amidase
LFYHTIGLALALPLMMAAGGKRIDSAEPAGPRDLTIALLQMNDNGTEPQANVRKADQWCREAAAKGADIILMPELWISGCADYPSDASAGPESRKRDICRAAAAQESRKRDIGKTRADMKKWHDTAIPRDGEYVRHFQALAKELKAAIVVTYMEKWPGAPRNSATLIDRHGNQVFTYAKVHTCDFGKEEAACTPGDDFYVEELDTAKGKIKVGIMICYDREHPESALVLALKGAELILTPNACVLDTPRLEQFRARAYENAVVTAMANYAGDSGGCNGQSCVVGPEGKPLVQAGKKEGVYTASFNLDKLREYRRKTIWGGAFRRPQRYKIITEFGELPEFRRDNGFGEKFVQSER